MAWFRGKAEQSGETSEIGVLLVNLGTPTAPAYGPIRRYLGSFLRDRRVVEACPAYWYPLLFGPILTFRPLRTAKLYQAVWMSEGSPLMVHSKQLADVLQQQLGHPSQVRVELAMTYGQPSIEAAVDRLLGAGVKTLYVLPLYPQYSGSTTGAVFDGVAKALTRWRRVPSLHFIADYHSEPRYIAALAASVRASWALHGKSHLVISNHGIPVKYVAQGDPYQQQVEKTAQLLVEALGLDAAEVSLVFQSRFGPTAWLQPYTDDRLVELAARGVRAITVVTPSFAVDCLETLEEIGATSQAKYLAAGGERFTLVPALNASADHAQVLRAVLVRAGLSVC